MSNRPSPHLADRTIRRWPLAVTLLAAALVLAACGSSGSDEAASDTTAASTTSSSSPATADESAETPTETTGLATPAVDLAPWQTIEITDVDGASFTLGDLAGRPVFVEAFATWCSNCRSQLRTTQAAAASLGDEAAFVALSVETSLSAEDVADYAEDNGFTSMRFAVMTPELLAAFVDAYGNSAVNPPSTPHVVIGASGAAGELGTGSIGDADIIGALRAAG